MYGARPVIHKKGTLLVIESGLVPAVDLKVGTVALRTSPFALICAQPSIRFSVPIPKCKYVVVTFTNNCVVIISNVAFSAGTYPER